MNVSGDVGKLEEESLKRKERLKALKNKLGAAEKGDDTNKKSITLPKPKFRSYNPKDDALRELKTGDAKPGDIESAVKGQLEASNHKEVIDILDISNLAPRKPDWDLKRDAAKKLEILERRTQRAIAELIRERLRAEEGTDLATSVAIGAELQATADEE